MSTPEEQQIRLSRVGNVCVITFTGTPHKANVFTIPLLRRFDALLDQVEEQLPCSLVIRGSGKFFSAGFDLQSLTGTGHNKSSSTNDDGQNKKQKQGKTTQGQKLVNYSWQILARLLIFPAPTICLFNGHAFGLGLFIGLACDHRVMLASNNGKGGGFLCLPEITIGLPLGSGFAALAKSKMNPSALKTSALTGKRFNHKDALKAGLIDDVVVSTPSTSSAAAAGVDTNDDGLPAQVLDMAEQLVSTSEKGNLSQIKMELYQEPYDVLVGRSSSSKIKSKL